MFARFFKNRQNVGENSQKAGKMNLVRGIDTEARYCLRCNDEYRAEVAVCAGCGEPLVSGMEKLAKLERETIPHPGRSMEIADDDELIGVRKGGIRDIKELQKLLEKERIPSIISGDEANCRKGCCGPEMYLLIRKTDLEPARSVFARDYVRSTALDSHDLHFGQAGQEGDGGRLRCPACGCEFSETIGACPDCGLCFD